MATASTSKEYGSPIVWDMLSPTGPTVAYHTSCLLGNYLYIHGGIKKKSNREPSAELHRLDLNSHLWQQVRAPNCPALSHHACVAVNDRYMMLIGGWTGKIRCSDIFVFDTEEEHWMNLKSHGFPAGAGLSSHTATPLADGRIMVIGREGSTRIVKRWGNAYVLSGSMDQGTYTWLEYSIEVGSRSGHTTHILGNTLYSIGGRGDKPYESHTGFKTGKPPCSTMKQIASFMSKLTPMSRPPCGRKHHVAVEGEGVVFIHGGETFDGRSRDPVAEIYLLATKPHMQWYKLGLGPVGRAGHTLATKDDVIIIHGGEGAKTTIYGDTYQLKIHT